MNSAEAIGSLLFLGLATGWLATLLVQHLFTAVGTFNFGFTMIQKISAGLLIKSYPYSFSTLGKLL